MGAGHLTDEEHQLIEAARANATPEGRWPRCKSAWRRSSSR
ncbi:MAG: hypothetical protein ACLUE1_01510 [Adlercreutzia equolifaciens]